MNQLRRKCEDVCRQVAPVDTGNLRTNGIKSRSGRNSFTIIYDDAVVPYILDLNKKGGAHEGFIQVNTMNAMSMFLTAELNNIASQYKNPNNANAAAGKSRQSINSASQGTVQFK